MKKLIMLIMAFCLIAPVANADLSKKDIKTVEKLAKDKMKEYKKDGWQIMGADPMQTALQKHFSQTNVGGAKLLEKTAEATAKSKNNGRQMCIAQAQAEYAKEWQTQVQAMTVTDGFEDQVNVNAEMMDRFYNAVVTKSEAEVKGELRESFTLYRPTSDGRYEFKMVFLVDPERASQARQRAIMNAAKEVGLSQNYLDKVNEFVNSNLSY